MRIVIGSTLAIGLLYIVVGCALSGPPVPQTQLTETEAIIRSAESAGAFDHAPVLLQKARQALGAAQRAAGKGDHSAARQYLLETTTYAEAARARAQAEQQKKEAAMVRQQADELEVKAEAVQKQLQVPPSGVETESDK
ncbi:MAG: DUF4398 domain-containing protein [Nitrospira sp.]|nr:DUF4398 domain-containing protein [Nitrospira sp.]MBS0154439.1 DUF4398 domain-containing protein [Nitrospira sp.]MBS0166936.1 DUF4398 domain-containing protein [Nitrospira sp.]